MLRNFIPHNTSKNIPVSTIINKVENNYRKNLENKYINVGDIVKITYLIPEGQKERIQTYNGIIIGIHNKGIAQSFILRRTVQGIGVEQIFFTHSPKILAIKIKQSSKIRRSKLYFLRNLSGKAARLKQKFIKN